jgi:hypothetical protein
MFTDGNNEIIEQKILVICPCFLELTGRRRGRGIGGVCATKVHSINFRKIQ